MKFVFFGSSIFAKTVLENLCSLGNKPSLVVSQPDKPKGRSLNVYPTLVSSFCRQNKMPFIKPASLKDGDIAFLLQGENADFFVVADYGRIIPEPLISMPSGFTLGIHPSLLPLYRGPAPINWAIINGDNNTGVTIFKVNERVDEGDIALQKTIPIKDSDDTSSLAYKLAIEGSSMVIEAMEKIKKGDLSFVKQDAAKASYGRKLHKEDGRIDWHTNAIKIRNLIRGTAGWPSAYFYHRDKMIKIIEAEVVELEINIPPSVIVSIDAKGICVAARESMLRIKKLKPEGKKEMTAEAFTCGYRLKPGDKLD